MSQHQPRYPVSSGQRGYGRQQQQAAAPPAVQPDPALLQAEMAKAQLQLHGKRFFIDTSSCTLPSNVGQLLFSSPPWRKPDLMEAKQRLNATKDLLDNLDIRPWGRHTTFTNRAGDVVSALRRGPTPPEMATIAWAKMFECLGSYELLPLEVPPPPPAGAPSHQQRLLTVHVCEAPGAFIAATNHFVKTHRRLWAHRWTWLANSLNPYHEGNDPNAMIDDDALIAATPAHWCFGADGSGDIRRPDNIRAIWQAAAAAGGGVLMVTGDGSVDCQEDPNEQEAATAALHFCELVCALGLLAPGGSMLLKMFTLFEHCSVGALFLAGCLFDQVHVVKPCSSKPGNSETYLVGLGFRGSPEPLLQALLQRCGPAVFESAALLPLELLPQPFLESAVQCAAFFGQQQEQIIRENLALYSFMPPATKEALLQSKRWLTDQWRQLFRLQPLDRTCFLAPNQSLVGNKNNSAAAVGASKRKTTGTLAERQEQYRKRRVITGQLGPEQAPGAAADGSGSSQQQQQLGQGWGKAAELLTKMGWQQGQGLGRAAQGAAQALDISDNRTRTGLGFGAAGVAGIDAAAVAALGSGVGRASGSSSDHLLPADPYQPKPDAAAFLNPAAAGQVAASSDVSCSSSLGRGTAATLSGQQVAQLLTPKVVQLPGALMRSKFLPDDELLLQLRDARQKAAAAAVTGSGQHAAGSAGHARSSTDCCLHLASPCVAPAGSSTGRSRPQWHIAALTKALGPLLPVASSSGLVRVLDLSSVDCSVARLVAQQLQPGSGQASALLLELIVSSTEDGRRLSSQPPKVEGSDADTTVELWEPSIRSAGSDIPAAAGGVQLVVGQLVSTAAAAAAAPPQDKASDKTAAAAAADAVGVMELEFSGSYQRDLLWEAAMGLSCLAEGGTLVLRLADSMTGFSAGLLQLLAECFARLTLFKPFSSCAASGERFAVCQGKLAGSGCQAAAAQLLYGRELLCDALEQQQQHLQLAGPASKAAAAGQPDGAASNLLVLELVQPAHIVSLPFYQYLAGRNIQLAKLEIPAQLAAAKAAQQLVRARQGRPQPKATAAEVAAAGLVLSDAPAAALAAGFLDGAHVAQFCRVQQAAETRLAAAAAAAGAGISSSFRAQGSGGSAVWHAAGMDGVATADGNVSSATGHPVSYSASVWSAAGPAQRSHGHQQHSAAGGSPPKAHSLELPPASSMVTSSSQFAQAVVAAKQSGATAAEVAWAGELWVTSAKGQEFVCQMRSDAWPRGLPRARTLLIQHYEPASSGGGCGSSCEFELAAATPGDAQKLKGLWQYLQGWRGAQKSSTEKAGVVLQGLQNRKGLLRAVTGAEGQQMLQLRVL